MLARSQQRVRFSHETRRRHSRLRSLHAGRTRVRLGHYRDRHRFRRSERFSIGELPRNGRTVAFRPSLPVPIVLDATSVWFRYERSDTSTLVAIATNLDEGSSWWLAQAGQVFTDETIEAGMFTPLIMIGPSFHPAASLPSYGKFYLAVRTKPSRFHDPAQPYVYGWAELSHPFTQMPDNQIIFGLTMVSNALSFYSQGIIIGTTTEIIPEPAALGTTMLGLMLATRRSRSHTKCVQNAAGKT
jgi:hypothetical protein